MQPEESNIFRAVLSLDRAARFLFNESAKDKDVLVQKIAARILGFTNEWLGSRHLDDDDIPD